MTNPASSPRRRPSTPTLLRAQVPRVEDLRKAIVEQIAAVAAELHRVIDG